MQQHICINYIIYAQHICINYMLYMPPPPATSCNALHCTSFNAQNICINRILYAQYICINYFYMHNT